MLSHCIIPAEGKARLFIDGRKLQMEAPAALAQVADIAEPSALPDALRDLGERGAKVRIDPASVSQWFANHLTEAGALLTEEQDPCVLPKARKNTAEIVGSRAGASA